MHQELREHIIKLLNTGIRLDGRKLTEYRKPIEVEQGVVKTAEGSARVKIGETDVMVGVKLEVGEPYPDTPDEGTIIVGAELLPLSNPEFELGTPGIQAIELARVVDRGIRESKALDFRKLCIEPGKKIWMVIIDICPINDAGNLFDASTLAALAALQDAKYPAFDGEKVDYKEKTDKRLELEKTPIAVTVIKIGDKFIVDPDVEEEKVIDARLTVSSIEDIDKMLDIGIEKAKELRKHL